MIDVPSFEYLIFDLDGVLIDSSPCHQAAYMALWNKLGVDGPKYDTVAGERTVEVVSVVTRSLQPTEADIQDWVTFKQKKARLEMSHSLRVFEGASESIRKLSNDGWRMSVATCASGESAHLALDQMGVTGCFDFIVTADEVTRGKPDPMVFSEVLKKTQVSPVNTLVLEDSLSGVEAAISAGIFVCTVHTGVHLEDKLFMGAYSDLGEALSELGVLR